MKPEKPIMTDAEVAEFFGVSVRTLQRRAKNCISQPNLGKVRTNLGHGRTKKPPCKVFAGGFSVV